MRERIAATAPKAEDAKPQDAAPVEVVPEAADVVMADENLAYSSTSSLSQTTIVDAKPPLELSQQIVPLSQPTTSKDEPRASQQEVKYD